MLAVLVHMLHPVKRFSTHCITSMATLLLSCRSSQCKPDTLHSIVVVGDRFLVTERICAYRTTLRATEILTPIVATLTPSPQGILHLVIPARFMQEVSNSLPLMLKYSTKQPLRTKKQYTVLWFNKLHYSQILALLSRSLRECFLLP